MQNPHKICISELFLQPIQNPVSPRSTHLEAAYLEALLYPFNVIFITDTHTAGSDTIFIQIYMDAPPGVPGVSKNSQKYATNKTVELLR